MNVNEEYEFEVKLERFSEELEALILDAFLAVLEKIKSQNDQYLDTIIEKKEEIRF